MAANPLSLPRRSRVQRPPIYFPTPAFKLIDFPCISVRKKPANDRLLLSCCCGAAVAINGNRSSKIVNDSSTQKNPYYTLYHLRNATLLFLLGCET